MRKLTFVSLLTSTLLLVAVIFNGCQKNQDDTLVTSSQPEKDIVTNTAGGSDIGGPTSASAVGTGYRIAILMYHNLVSGAPASEYDRTKTDFENDLKYIKSKNYQLLSFDDLLKLKAGTLQLKSNAVIISFDDGYASVYTKAFPLLKKYSMPATFFIVPEFIGTTNYMTWGQVWNLSVYKNSKGLNTMSIESHSSSHPFLAQSKANFTPEVYQNFLDLQLGESKDWIADVTGQSTMFLALPYGDGADDIQIMSTAIMKGYSGIRTSKWGAFTVDKMDMFSLPSLPILSTTTISSIEDYMK